MDRSAIRTAFGVVAVGVAPMALACGLESDEMQSRAPIDVASLGPQVGERVPGFRLPDQNGRIRTLESVSGPEGTLLLFHRSADW